MKNLRFVITRVPVGALRAADRADVPGLTSQLVSRGRAPLEPLVNFKYWLIYYKDKNDGNKKIT